MSWYNENKDEIDTIIGASTKIYSDNKEKIVTFFEDVVKDKVSPVLKNKSAVLIGLGVVCLLVGLGIKEDDV